MLSLPGPSEQWEKQLLLCPGRFCSLQPGKSWMLDLMLVSAPSNLGSTSNVCWCQSGPCPGMSLGKMQGPAELCQGFLYCRGTSNLARKALVKEHHIQTAISALTWQLSAMFQLSKSLYRLEVTLAGWSGLTAVTWSTFPLVTQPTMAVKAGGFNLRPKYCCDNSTFPLNIILPKPKSLATNWGNDSPLMGGLDAVGGSCSSWGTIWPHTQHSLGLLCGQEASGNVLGTQCPSVCLTLGETAASLVIRGGGEHSKTGCEDKNSLKRLVSVLLPTKPACF